MFQEWFEEWIHDYYPSSIDSPEGRTRSSYIQYFRDYILPKLGNVPLKELSPSHIRKFITWLEKEAVSIKNGQKLSRTTQAHISAALHKCLQDAAGEEKIDRNPAEYHKISLPKNSNIAKPYDEDELHQLLSTKGIRRYPLIVTLAWTAARPSEAIALPWRNLDLYKRTLLIDRSLESRSHAFKCTKTGRERTIDLFSFNCAVLAEHRQNSKFNGPDDLIFAAADGGPANESVISHDFSEDLENFGLRKIRLYDLRHSCITWLLNQPGMPLKAVQERAGHASAEMTLDRYGHHMDGVQRRAIRTLDSQMFRKPLLYPTELQGRCLPYYTRLYKMTFILCTCLSCIYQFQVCGNIGLSPFSERGIKGGFSLGNCIILTGKSLSVSLCQRERLHLFCPLLNLLLVLLIWN
jgi:integrase